MALTSLLPGRSREAELLEQALEGRLPRRQLTPAIGGYAAIADRLGQMVPTTTLQPAPEFRAELHERLVELALARAAASVTSEAAPTQAAPTQAARTQAELTRHEPNADAAAAPQTTPDRARRPWVLVRGWRRTATAATGALLALSVGVGFASAGALPGGLLYPVKELIQSAQLHLANGDLGRGHVLLDQAGDHISDARTLVQDGGPDPADVDTALRAAAGDLAEGQQDLLRHFARTQDPRALSALARFASTQSPILTQLRARVPVVSEPLVDRLLTQVGGLATSVRTLAQRCGAPCAAVPVGSLPGPDGRPGGSSAADGAGAAASAGPGGGLGAGTGSGLGGLLGTGGAGGTGSSARPGGAGSGGAGGPVSVGSGGVGVQLPGVGATVPAPGGGVGPGGTSVGVPPVSATLGPVSATLPGVGVTLPPPPSHSSSHSTPPAASSSSTCLLVVCVG